MNKFVNSPRVFYIIFWCIDFGELQQRYLVNHNAIISHSIRCSGETETIEDKFLTVFEM